MNRIIILIALLFISDKSFTQSAISNDSTFMSGTGCDWIVYSFLVQPDNKIIAGGSFISYNNITRNYIVRLNPNGSIDNTFSPALGFNSTVQYMRLQPDGKILASGNFSQYDGVLRMGAARINTDATLDLSFNTPLFLGGPIELQPDGKVLIGQETFVVRLNTDGTIDNTFNSQSAAVLGEIYTLALQADGKIIVGGDFISANNGDGIMRLNTDGSRDTTFTLTGGPSTIIRTTLRQPDDKILLAGTINQVNTFPFTGKDIIRLKSDGTLDTLFVPDAVINGSIYSLALDSISRIIAGGEFQYFNGHVIADIIRLNVNGQMDVTFNPDIGFMSDGFFVDSIVYALALQPGNKIIAGGDFVYFDGDVCNYITRLTDSITITAINEEKVPLVHIYPNPAADFIHIDFGKDRHETIKWTLRNLSGKLIDESTSFAAVADIDITGLRSGIYLLELFKNSYTQHYKIVVNR